MSFVIYSGLHLLNAPFGARQGVGNLLTRIEAAFSLQATKGLAMPQPESQLARVEEVEPILHDGLAVYAAGQGDSVLLMPAPHSFTAAPAAHGALAAVLRGFVGMDIGRRRQRRVTRPNWPARLSEPRRLW